MFKDENELIEYISLCNEKRKFLDGLQAIIDNADLISKKYYELTKFKISFLIELDKLIDASVIIKEELDVPYVPLEFEKFLVEKQKEISFALKDKHRKVLTIEDIEQIDKLNDDTLIYLLPSLNDFNLNKYTDKFQNIFNRKDISNLNKSLLIAALSDYKLDYDFTIKKEDVLINFNPITVKDIRFGKNMAYLESELKNLFDVEINIVDLIKRLSITYLLDIYPLELSNQTLELLICACIILAREMSNSLIQNDKYDKLIANNYDKIEKYINKINNLLENV